MLPTINEFVSKYGLENFVVVADSGLMNNANIAELEAHGYKYIIGAKINIQTTVQRMMPITGRREYAGWKRLTSMARSLKATSTKEIRPMFHFTRKRIEAHICICFVALKVYKELERMLKVSEIKMSVDKVLALAKTITTIQIRLPLNKDVYTQTMLMARHQKIAKLFDEDFWVTQ